MPVVVSVSVAVPAESCAAVGVNVAFSVDALGVKVPPPAALQSPPVAVVTEPVRVIAGEEVQAIRSKPAFADIPEGWAITVIGEVTPGQLAS